MSVPSVGGMTGFDPTDLSWLTQPCRDPHGYARRYSGGWPDYSTEHLQAAEAAVRDAIALLQHAQTTEWRSVAAECFRSELYAAILALRSIDDALDEARQRVTVLHRTARTAVGA